MASALLGLWLSISVAIAVMGAIGPGRLLLFSDPHGRGRIVEAMQAGSPLAASLATFTTEDWLSPVAVLVPWLAAACVALAVMIACARRRLARNPLGVAAVGSVCFVAVAGILTANPAAAVREETSQRGALNLIWAYDGERHRSFEYGELRKVTPEEFLRLSTPTLKGVPGGPVSLPPGAYETRVWFKEGGARTGEIVVSSTPNAIFGRADGALQNPAVIPFELPVGVGRLSVNIPDRAVAAGVARIEIVPTAVVPRSRRADIPVRAVESIAGTPGSYIVYTDDRAYPEGGVFWTRGTEAATILVAPANASRIVLTLHLGPQAGEVRVSVAGQEHVAAVEADGIASFETPVPEGLRLVPITVQAPGMFRPADVDPASTDRRRLGCQVRVELR
jgi:hypothetical protein